MNQARMLIVEKIENMCPARSMFFFSVSWNQGFLERNPWLEPTCFVLFLIISSGSLTRWACRVGVGYRSWHWFICSL